MNRSNTPPVHGGKHMSALSQAPMNSPSRSQETPGRNFAALRGGQVGELQKWGKHLTQKPNP